ncbi:hypothetical protein CANMA_000959 [Candida margitis]|uniref:uncharacterized protein n=1 Tax=Candida margitis TaxID=1775924 RepID=UPI0022263B2A|nr:uncharacterized protein CANMA_000959 [Candida margitis]KAI5969919.1 hypothetical protein CANMA_000959 [Candida margitis]
MSDTADHDNSLLESTTNLNIDNNEADTSTTSHHPQSQSRSRSHLPTSPPPSSAGTTSIANTTVDSSVSSGLRNHKMANETQTREGKSTEISTSETQGMGAPTTSTIPPIITDVKLATEPFVESLSTSPTSPTTFIAPRESFKSHSATSSTSTLTPEDQERISTKEKNLDEIKQQCSCLIHELEGNEQPEVIIKKHIQQLKKYNELKDVALQLVTLIADQRQVKTTDILNEMKLEVGENGNEI